jgi:uncharacterized protein
MKRFSLRIDKDGRWFSNEEEITHRKTYLLYSRNLVRDASGGILLRIGKEEWPVEVEDAPYVVRSLDFDTAEDGELARIALLLNDETREPLVPETLRIGAANVPYCRIRAGQFDARFSRNAYQILLPHIHHNEKKGKFFLPIAGREYPLIPETETLASPARPPLKKGG